MDARRAPQGLHAEDRIALGLSAAHLFYLVIFSMSGWGIISSRIPGVVSFPAGVLLIAIGIALAWGRPAGRPLDRWVWLYVAYRARPRRGGPPSAAPDHPIDPAEPAPATRGAEQAVPPTPAAARGDRGIKLSLPNGTATLGDWHKPLLAHQKSPGAGRRRARRCAFFSYRGGTGKTSLAAEVASLLASCTVGSTGRPTRVALLDLDISSSSLGVRLGLDGPCLSDLQAAPDIDAALMERVLLRHESGARVALGPAPGPGTADPYAGLIPRVARLFAYLDEQQFDVVLVDLRGTTGDLDGYALEAVDAIYYVFTPTPCGIFDLYRGVAQLRRTGQRAKLRLVLNHADADVDISEVLGDLRMDAVAEIPTLAAIAAAEGAHLPACLSNDSVGEVLRDLALSIYPDAVASATDSLQVAPVRR